MARISIVRIAAAKERGSQGVDYSPRLGAICPWCGKRAKIVKTLPWEDRTRIRYHRCHTEGCLMATMGNSIKSIEVDHVELEETVCRK